MKPANLGLNGLSYQFYAARPKVSQGCSFISIFYCRKTSVALLTHLVRILITILSFLFSAVAYSQKPRNGTYTYKIAYAEWNGRSMGSTCTVVIKGDSIKVIHNGSNVSGTKGEIFDEGIIMKHKKTGKWIIGHSRKDADAKEIGGCSEGPTIIDFKNKKWWTC